LVATELGRRFRLPKWCFSNSGTEAVSDAVRIARAATGRDVVLKVEGGYHGDSDAVMSSVYPSLEALEARAPFEGVPFLGGIPTQVSELSRTIRYNDLSDLEAAIDQFGDRIAALIMEPVMTNINVVQPREGYLERVKQLTAENGIKLVFDEVKTGATIAPGGVVSRFGVTPDMVAIAKASFGGYPGGALGISAELAEVIESGAVSHMGTFNGNPLTMTAAITTLTEVLTDAAYERFEEVNENLLGGCRRIIDQYELPAYTEGLGAKGSVIFSSERLYDYRDYLSKVDVELSRLAWFYLMNHGVLIIPGTETDWTLSVAHGDDEVELYVETFEAFARDVRGA
jgi:glutamate-1-semialdehyde 2,1-aminomutase